MSCWKKTHRNQVLTTEDRKAEKLFRSKEEAITFAEDYGFDEAHVELLHTSGKIFESAEVLANGGRIVDAVKTLITKPAPDRTRRAVEYLSTGLWQHQSFGTDHPTTDAEVVSQLLALADTLRNEMQIQEAQEVRLLPPCGVVLILKKHRSRCSEQDTTLISKHSVLYISSSPEQEIPPLLCCVLTRSSPPLYPSTVLPQSTLGPRFPSILHTSSF